MSVQPHDQMADQAITSILVNDGSEIRENFKDFFNSIAKKNVRKNEIYHKILKQEATREQQTFDTMKEELQIAQNRNAHKKQNFYEKIDVSKNVKGTKRETNVNDGGNSGNPPISIDEEYQQRFLANLSTEDRARLDRLKLSDITRKGLRFVLLVNKTKEKEVEPRVYDVLSNFTTNLEKLRDDIILLRDEIESCGNVSNISLCNSWKKAFKLCIINTDTELYAVECLTKVIAPRAKFIKDLKYELRLKPVDKTLLEKAIKDLNFAMHQFARGDFQKSVECQRTMEQIPNALIKFQKSLVLARHYLQMQLVRLESSTQPAERLLNEY